MTGHLLVAWVLAGTLGAFTDWLFMGVLFHERYDRYPEVWRPSVREGRDKGAIIASIALGYVASAAVVAACAFSVPATLPDALSLGFLIWIASALPILVVNGFFIKIDGLITAAHAVGWLVRILLAAIAFVLVP
jgi:hypothetical protein